MTELAFEPTIDLPVQGEVINTPSVTVSALPISGKLVLRAEGDAIAKAVKKALKLELPKGVTEHTRADGVEAMWMGPDETLLVCEIDQLAAHQAAIAKAAAKLHHSLVDVSDYYISMQIQGVKAREVLAKHVPADMHSSAFADGTAIRTRFAKATAVLVARGDDTFELMVRWSFAQYAAELLRVSCLEYA